MPKVSVYMPDDLATQARAAGLSLSHITQEAVRQALEAVADKGQVYASVIASDRGSVTVTSVLGTRIVELRTATQGPITMDNMQAASVSDALKRAVAVAEGHSTTIDGK